MKKLFLAFLCFAFLITASGSDAWWNTRYRIVTDADCASGTYERHWNGEHSTGIDYYCENSGASASQATDVAGVIVSGGAINGSYGAQLDANDEYIRITYSDATWGDEGTMAFNLTTPSSFSGNAGLAAGCEDGQNRITIYFIDSSDQMIYEREGNNITRNVGSGVSSVGTSTTYSVAFTWSVAGDDLCWSLQSGKDQSPSWSCTNGLGVSAFDLGVSNVSVGDETNCSVDLGISGTWKVDDFEIRDGYEGT